MRVLLTEFYPDGIPPSAKWRGERAFAVAWFSIPSNQPVDTRPAFFGFKDWSFIDLDQAPRTARAEYTHHVVSSFVDLSVGLKISRGRLNTLTKAIEIGRFFYVRPRPFHADAVDSILQSAIVIERSPAESIPFHLLVDKANYIALGAFVGYTATAGAAPWLMMISIPGGIIVMGAAVGVSRGLMNGLHRVVEKLISGSDHNPVVIDVVK